MDDMPKAARNAGPRVAVRRSGEPRSRLSAFRPMLEDGKRKRVWSERKKVERHLADRAGHPLHDDVTLQTRERIFRDMRAWLKRCPTSTPSSVDRWGQFVQLVEQKLGDLQAARLDRQEFRDMTTDEFVDVLEMATNFHWLMRRMPSEIDEINSLLADDRSRYRLRNVGTPQAAHYEVQHIDNKHLHTVIVDRTFELTTIGEFSSAQNDYAQAWREHTKAVFDQAIFLAARAVEAACKLVVSKVDPAADINDKSLNAVTVKMSELGIIPSQFQTTATALNSILQTSGVLRNVPGVGHGSLEVENFDASLSLLALRMSGSLISFLAARWIQMSAPPAPGGGQTGAA